MSNSATTTDPQAGKAVVPQAGTDTSQVGKAVVPQAGTDTSQVDTPKAPEADGSSSPDKPDEVAKVRAEAAKHRRELREAQKELEQLRAAEKARADAELSEAEKAARRAKELEVELEATRSRVRESLTEAAVTAAAARLGYADARDAVALMPRGDVEYDDDGKPDPAAIDTALKALLAERPHLRAGHTAGGSPTNPARGGQTGETDQQRRARLYGGHPAGGIFDTATAASRGGGVVAPNDPR